MCFGYERELVLAYNQLTIRRQMGFTAGPIPLSEIESFVRLYGPPQMPMDIFVELLGVMDHEYLQKLNSHGNRRTHRPPSNR